MEWKFKEQVAGRLDYSCRLDKVVNQPLLGFPKAYETSSHTKCKLNRIFCKDCLSPWMVRMGGGKRARLHFLRFFAWDNAKWQNGCWQRWRNELGSRKGREKEKICIILIYWRRWYNGNTGEVEWSPHLKQGGSREEPITGNLACRSQISPLPWRWRSGELELDMAKVNKCSKQYKHRIKRLWKVERQRESGLEAGWFSLWHIHDPFVRCRHVLRKSPSLETSRQRGFPLTSLTTRVKDLSVISPGKCISVLLPSLLHLLFKY